MGTRELITNGSLFFKWAQCDDDTQAMPCTYLRPVCWHYPVRPKVSLHLFTVQDIKHHTTVTGCVPLANHWVNHFFPFWKENGPSNSFVHVCLPSAYKRESLCCKAQANAVNTRVLLLVNWKWLNCAESNWLPLKSAVGSSKQSKKTNGF